MQGRARWRAAVLLVVAALLEIGCSREPAPAPRVPVTVQLKWFHQAQFAGFYVAADRGYYAAEGLAVDLVPGGPQVDVLDRVAKGEAQFGVSAPEDILVARGRGSDVVALAALFRKNPSVFITLAGSGIETPRDFLGKTISFMGRDDRVRFLVIMKRLGLDPRKVREVPYEYDYQSFLRGDTAVTIGYTTGGVLRLRKQGHALRLIWPDDYGVHVYSDTLVAREALCAAKPDLVARFLRAALRGWREAVEDPAAAVEATLRRAKEPDRALQTAMMEASGPLLHTGEGPVGSMQPAVWNQTARMLVDQGLLPVGTDARRAYTLEFLRRVYAEAK
ncbi:MAG: ABC transporter substrate-binding protein [Deltaproteobacteria bacterium]|nr:ABC transporter substrate-binding protein [Deltaproteobacteria bacterium]